MADSIFAFTTQAASSSTQDFRISGMTDFSCAVLTMSKASAEDVKYNFTMTSTGFIDSSGIGACVTHRADHRQNPIDNRHWPVHPGASGRPCLIMPQAFSNTSFDARGVATTLYPDGFQITWDVIPANNYFIQATMFFGLDEADVYHIDNGKSLGYEPDCAMFIPYTGTPTSQVNGAGFSTIDAHFGWGFAANTSGGIEQACTFGRWEGNSPATEDCQSQFSPTSATGIVDHFGTTVKTTVTAFNASGYTIDRADALAIQLAMKFSDPNRVASVGTITYNTGATPATVNLPFSFTPRVTFGSGTLNTANDTTQTGADGASYAQIQLDHRAAPASLVFGGCCAGYAEHGATPANADSQAYFSTTDVIAQHSSTGSLVVQAQHNTSGDSLNFTSTRDGRAAMLGISTENPLRQVEETEEIGDTVLVFRDRTRTVSETVEIGDSVIVSRGLVRVVAETESITDTAFKFKGLARVVAESQTIVDTAIAAVTRENPAVGRASRIATPGLAAGRTVAPGPK